MTKTKILVGSLSNDLLRVANLSYRGSDKAAAQFYSEARRWAVELKNQPVKDYIKDIAVQIDSQPLLDSEMAETYLMYSVLLQNYSLHMD
jgi:hypothetical protein